jgi:hypothetical protein
MHLLQNGKTLLFLGGHQSTARYRDATEGAGAAVQVDAYPVIIIRDIGQQSVMLMQESALLCVAPMDG